MSPDESEAQDTSLPINSDLESIEREMMELHDKIRLMITQVTPLSNLKGKEFQEEIDKEMPNLQSMMKAIEDRTNILGKIKKATIISIMIHSAKNIDELQRIMDSMQFDAATLMEVVAIERKKQASELEKLQKQKENENKAAAHARAVHLARLSHSVRPATEVKPLVMKYYEEYAAKKDENGVPLFKTQASFIKDALKEYGEKVTDGNTIMRWIKESDMRVHHWKTRKAKVEK
jgi:hypothetical protein